MPTTGSTTPSGLPAPATLTVAEFAREFQCSQRTVRRAIRKGTIRSCKIERLVRVPRSELERLLKTSTRPHTDAEGRYRETTA